MKIRCTCEQTRWDAEEPSVCGTVFEVDNVCPVAWIENDLAFACPGCGWTLHSRDGGFEILDHGLPLAVCLVARNEQGQVLAISRRDDHSAFGLPGGKVDPVDDAPSFSERIRNAMAREAREEIGVDLDRALLDLEYQLPDPSGYWNFCFRVEPEHVAHAKTQDGEGVVAWVGWDTLESGPFGYFNRRLNAHLWESDKWLDPGTSDEEVDDFLRAHGGDPEAIGARIFDLSAESEHVARLMHRGLGVDPEK